MHFEILVEDQSSKRALDILIPKIIAGSHTFKIIYFKGIGHVPRCLNKQHQYQDASAAQPASCVAEGVWKDVRQLSGGGDRGL